MTGTIEELSFEECMAELTELVSKLESGNLDLDESLKVYERAVLVRARCKAILDDADRKVQKIMESSDGIRKEPFDEE